MQIGYETHSQEMYIYRTIKLCKQHFVILGIKMARDSMEDIIFKFELENCVVRWNYYFYREKCRRIELKNRIIIPLLCFLYN